MKILTWNLDGLDEEKLFDRTVAAIPTFHNYDVIFLQEVVKFSKDLIIPNTPDYHNFTGASIPDYFVMILIKKSAVRKITANYGHGFEIGPKKRVTL